MKKLSIFILSLICLSTTIAQPKDLFKEVNTAFFVTKNIEHAKIAIDKVLNDANNAKYAEAWLWKTRIESEIINNEALLIKYPTSITTCFEAFKKYEELDNSYTLISDALVGWKPLGSMYDKYYNIGRVGYQAQDWNKAFEYFDKTAYLAKIIMKKDLKKNGGSLDTLPILMSGYSAQNAQKLREALHYYSIAADAKFGGPNDVEMYKYILVGYSDLKDKNKFEKYYELAQKLYPTENFEDYKFDFINKNYTIDEKISEYQNLDLLGNMTGKSYLNYGDLFVTATKEEKEALEKTPEKLVQLHIKARDAYKKAFTKSNNVLAAYNAGILYFNDYSDLDDSYRENVRTMQEINTSKPIEKDPKKKAAVDAKIKEQLEPLKKANADIEIKILENADQAIEWLEKVYITLKDKTDLPKTEKSSFKNSVKFLGTLFEYKAGKVKGKDLKAYDAFDAKTKFYYEIFDKL